MFLRVQRLFGDLTGCTWAVLHDAKQNSSLMLPCSWSEYNVNDACVTRKLFVSISVG